MVVSYFTPPFGRSAVVGQHSARALGVARVAIGRPSREFLDAVSRFRAQARRLPCDARFAQAFNVRHSLIERVNKLASRVDHETLIRHAAPLIHARRLRRRAELARPRRA